MKRNIDGEMVKGHTGMLVLALLQTDGSMHGYRIRQDLADLSRHILQPSFGSLYPLLAQLEKSGWLKSRTELVGERRERKTYRITAKGRTELKRRAKKWALFSAGINRILNR